MQAIRYQSNISIIDIQEIADSSNISLLESKESKNCTKPLITYTKNNQIFAQYGGDIVDIISIREKVIHDTMAPLYMHARSDGLIYIKNILTQAKQNIAHYKPQEVTSLFLCNGNAYIYMRRHNSIRGYMSNESQRLYSGYVSYSSNKHIVLVRFKGNNRLYSLIDLSTGEESVIVRTQLRLVISYCNRKYIVYKERDAAKEAETVFCNTYIIMRLSNKSIEKIDNAYILNTTKKGIMILRNNNPNEYIYYNFEEDTIKRYTGYVPNSLIYWGIDQEYKGAFRVYFAKKIGDAFYAQIYFFKPENEEKADVFYDNIFVRCGRCCICGELTYKGSLCESTPDVLHTVYGQRPRLHCSYVYRDTIKILLGMFAKRHNADYPDIIDHIYEMTFGTRPRADKSNRLGEMAHFYRIRTNMKDIVRIHGYDRILDII